MDLRPSKPSHLRVIERQDQRPAGHDVLDLAVQVVPQFGVLRNAAALDQALVEAEGRVARRTAELASELARSGRDLFLGALARAASTPDGWFTIADLVERLPAGVKSDEALGMLRQLTSIDGLIEVESALLGERYRFIDEALPTFLWMMIARRHLLAMGDDEAQSRLFPEDQPA